MKNALLAVLRRHPILTMLASTIVLLVAIVVAMQLLGQRYIARQLAAIRARGEPTTAAEWQEWRARKFEGEDITELWVEALAHFESPAYQAAREGLPIFDYEAPLPPLPGRPWPDLEKVEAFLAAHSTARAALQKALDAEGYVAFHQDIRTLLMDEIMQLRATSRHLQLEGRVRAHRSEYELVLNTVRDILKVAEVTEHGHLLVSELLRGNIRSDALAELRALGPHLDVPVGDLLELERQLQACRTRVGWTDAWISERLFGIMIFSGEIEYGETLVAVMRLSPMAAQDQAMHLAFCDDIIASSRLPMPEFQRETREIAHRFDAEMTTWFATFSHMITDLVAPVTELPTIAAGRHDADLAATATLLAARRFELAEGRWPHSLEELVPEFIEELPIDPFDGAPLRYRLEEGRAILYSVGPDGIDGGGVTDGWPPGPDYAFEWVFPAER